MPTVVQFCERYTGRAALSMQAARSLAYVCCILLSSLAASAARAQSTSQTGMPATLSQTEEAYADFNDASAAVSLIDSDPVSYPDRSYGGKNRDAWQKIYVAKRAELLRSLKRTAARGLSAADARA